MHIALLVVFVVLLLAFPRQILLICGLGIAGVVGLLVMMHENGERNARKLEALLADVEMAIRYDVNACSAEYPLNITTTNRSKDLTIKEIEFVVGAYKPNHSNLIVKTGEWTSDRIIRPGQSYGSCWKVPYTAEKVDPATLEWKLGKRDGKWSRG